MSVTEGRSWRGGTRSPAPEKQMTGRSSVHLNPNERERSELEQLERSELEQLECE